jgi:dimethylargininase
MTDPLRARLALTRAIPDSFPNAVVQSPPATPIQVDRARRQHAAYVAALESLGVEVKVLPALPQFPDCCFVEDCAVSAEGVTLITRLGVPSRQGEAESIADALRPYARLEFMTGPATLEGGDCLRIDKRWYVGLSNRTNLAGARRLREVFGPLGYDVVEVPLGDVLHLKCVCSYLGGGWLLLAEETIPAAVFRDVRVIPVPAVETYAANCLSVNGTVLVSAGFPATRQAIEAAGLRVRELETTEFRKADGSLTCLSLLL